MNVQTKISSFEEPATTAIPRSYKDITCSWLNQVLAPQLGGARVLGCQAKPFSDPGQTADVVDVTLHYDSKCADLPKRMIAKLAALDPDTRAMCKTFRLYERETDFYNGFCGADLPLARCFHAAHDPATLDTVILLEHLAPSQSASYAITPDQVRIAIEEVSKLHAHWWNDDFVKRQSALVQLDDPDHWPSTAEGALGAINEVRRLMGSRCDASIEAMQLYSSKLGTVMQYVQSRPFTLMHSDYHGKQMFFPASNGEGKFAIIDFQFSVAGPGAFDVSRILNLGLDSNLRQACEASLIDAYVSALAKHGVGTYSRDDFMIDHRLGTMFTQLINFIAIAQTDQALLARECAEAGLDWKEVWLMRGERMMRELDVPGFLRAL